MLFPPLFLLFSLYYRVYSIPILFDEVRLIGIALCGINCKSVLDYVFRARAVLSADESNIS